MTAMERAAGRFLRAPDGHPEGGVVDVTAPTPAPDAAEEPAPLPINHDIPTSTEDAYDKEFEGVTLDDTPPEGQGEEEPEDGETLPEGEAEQPGAPEEEKTAEQIRIEELERELAELRRPKKEEKPTEQPEPEAVEDKAPNPDDYEFGKADDKFIEDLARWSARQEHAVLRKQESLEAELNTIETGWKGAITAPEIAEQYPDFHEKVTVGAENQTWDCSVPMALLIKNSDVGPHIAYELASNPTEATRLSKLAPQELLLEFGRIEGRHMAKAEASPAPAPNPTPAPKRETAAPKPPANRSRGAGGQFETEQGAMYDRMLKEFK